MFLFGHLGITLGIAVLLFRMLKIEPNRQRYAAVLIGAILPDLIDKPIGEILLSQSLSNGRLFAHTLLFVFILLLFIGLLYGYKRNGELFGFMLCGAAFIHLCEDRMWLTPETLFYPAFGFAFPQGIVELHWWDYFIAAFSRTYSLSPEAAYAFYSDLIGITILLLFALQWLSTHRWKLQ
jgi:membrane-bound metal-dependent hydrolase YbcI (DUF457 family)